MGIRFFVAVAISQNRQKPDCGIEICIWRKQPFTIVLGVRIGRSPIAGLKYDQLAIEAQMKQASE